MITRGHKKAVRKSSGAPLRGFPMRSPDRFRGQSPPFIRPSADLPVGLAPIEIRAEWSGPITVGCGMIMIKGIGGHVISKIISYAIYKQAESADSQDPNVRVKDKNKKKPKSDSREGGVVD